MELLEIKTKEPLAFLLIGRAGCGKGTQADLLLKYFKEKKLGELIYIYTGQKMREIVQHNITYTSKLAGDIMEKGGIEPSFFSVWVWADEMIKNMKKETHLILDGSPRALVEAMMVDGALQFYKREKVFPVFIETSRDWSRQKLLKRGRFDDTEKSINERLNYFDELIMPVIDYYEKKSKYKLVKVNGERSIEEVHREILEKVFK